jgi:hypothetical protein
MRRKTRREGENMLLLQLRWLMFSYTRRTLKVCSVQGLSDSCANRFCTRMIINWFHKEVSKVGSPLRNSKVGHSKFSSQLYYLQINEQSLSYWNIQFLSRWRMWHWVRSWWTLGLWEVEAPTFSDIGKVVSPTLWPLFTPGIFLVHISVSWVDPRATVWVEGLGKLKKSTSSETRNGDLPACSTVPQPTTLPRAPLTLSSTHKLMS